MHSLYSLHKLSLKNWLATYAYTQHPDIPEQDLLDCRLAFCYPRALSALGKTITRTLDPEVQYIGGSELISISASQESADSNHPVSWFSITNQHISVPSHTPVAIVAETISTGNSIIKTLNVCKKHKLNIVQIIVLVDLEYPGGLNNLKLEIYSKIGLTIFFTKTEIKQQWWEIYKNDEY